MKLTFATQLFFVNALLSVLSEGNELSHGDKLVQWLREKGGYFNDKLEIRRADPMDSQSRFGMFTNADLKKREILIIIPKDCTLTDESKDEDKIKTEEGEEEDYSAMNCKTVRNLIKEMKLGDESKYAPYVNYLLAEPWGQLPSSWSTKGKDFFLDILEMYTIEPMPPIEPGDWLLDWYDICKGSKDPFEENAALLSVQRSWDDKLIPVYDMMSHRNGHWLNTASNSVHEDSDIVVKAKRDIQAGEEIYTSYNMCEDCGGRIKNYGTPEIFRDYGFIEQYPQRWIFPNIIGFQIDEKEEGSGNFSLSWINGSPTIQGVKMLQDMQQALKQVSEHDLKNPDESIPSNEIATIRKYVETLREATEFALEKSYGDDEACSAEDQVCTISSNRYDDLNEGKEIEYNVKVCEIEEIMEFNDYDVVEEIQTPYQFISVIHNFETKDTCFDLDDTVQICANYRPHYHEMSVHYAARYIKSINRVLFVGGGDSMLLYEVLQYPSLELVVGLELDQKVTRMSFKYFGTQPHWDNEKVEWWFGDATKSLLMLPKDYFGSFDMVLVDLSETVTSFKVTDELDIIEALSLLLKPDGIMLKNEFYFGSMSNIFEHTLQYFYHGVPVICSQSMVLGSNTIDFFRHKNLTDHNIENILIDPLDYAAHFSFYHDYAWKPDNFRKHCVRDNDNLSKVPPEQISSPGIIMIVEAEDTSFIWHSLEKFSRVVENVLEMANLTIIAKIVPEPKNNDDVIVVVMQEGYVVSRFWPENNYCGFDIHLWSQFSIQESLKKSLVSAIGSSNFSSYRVVAGGMFGANSWKSDESGRGPRRTLSCDSSDSIASKTSTNSDLMFVTFEENIKFLQRDATVLVVCGFKESESCTTLKILQQNDKVGTLVEVWSCPNINEFAKDTAMLSYACERDLLSFLRNRLSDEQKLDAIVFDPTMNYLMGQIIVRIFMNIKTRMELLEENPFIIAISVDKSWTWRSNLVNRFRTGVIVFEPVFKADVIFESSDSNIHVHIVSTHEDTVTRLRSVLTSIEERTGVNANIKDMLGGTPVYNPNFSPDREYKPDDYDRIFPLEQWSSQRTLEHQIIFQLEVQRAKTQLSKSKIRDAFENAISSIDSVENPSTRPQMEEFVINEGCLFIALWSGSRVVIVWDGRRHVDINLTTGEGKDEYFDKFEKHFLKHLPSLKTILRDEQPRGYGRVVNFSKDTKTSNLVWA